MRKGEKRYNTDNIPIYFIPKTMEEQWLDINNIAVPGVYPYYMISNYGRVFHKYRNQFMKVAIDTKGYLYISLATENGTINCRVHRLVMMTFCYFEGCQNLLVNHKDGIKSNCIITNLEWCNYSENAIHAYKNELNYSYSKYDKNKVIEVCKMLEDQSNKIADIAKHLDVSIPFVRSIQGKYAHTDISDNYNIKPRKINNNFTIDQVLLLCNYYQNNPKNDNADIYCKNAIINVGISNNPSTREIRTAKKILFHETYKYISKDYIF